MPECSQPQSPSVSRAPGRAFAQQPTPATGTVLGFDFGTRRIGVATGEIALRQAYPLCVIDAPDNATRFASIADLLATWRPVLLVVGLPVFLDGSQHAMTARARRFANQLAGRCQLPVHFADERLSSLEADQRLRALHADLQSAEPRRQHGGRQKTGSRQDAIAAQLILESWFDASAHGLNHGDH